MSLIFNPSRFGSGSLLKTDLVEWWEDANRTGKHSDLYLDRMLNDEGLTIQTGGPNGLNYWSAAGASVNPALEITTGLSISGDWSSIVAVRLTDFTYDYFMADSRLRAVPYGGQTIHVNAPGGRVESPDWDYPAGGSAEWTAVALSYNSAGDSFAAYMVWSSAQKTLTGTWGDTSDTMTYFSILRRKIESAIGAIYSRQLTMDDVLEFYNNGNFLTYSDL